MFTKVKNNFEVISINISNLALTKIKPNMTISLGGGQNVFKLAQTIKQASLAINLVSPSEMTRYNCQKIGLFVHSLNETDQIDIAFDGCDSVDYSLNTLKSGGNIYLYEKIAAQMSKEYILLLPQERIQKELSTKVPLSIEVASPAVKQIMNFCHSLNLKAELRLDTSSFARSPLGNLIIDIYKPNWNDIAQINEQLLKQNGVIASSYFPNLVTSLITTNNNNEALEIKKGDLK